MERLMRPTVFSIKLIMLLFLAASVSSITFGQPLPATVSVSPSSVTSSVGQDFEINVTVSGVSDLYGWEAILTWNSTLLVAVNVTEGPFLKSGGGTTFFTYTANATDGSVRIDCTLTGLINGINGDGTLATVTLLVNNAGECPLHLSEAILVNTQDPPNNQIVAQTVDGYGYFAAVSGLATLKTVVGRDFSDGINVTVVNNNGDTEAFDVTLYADTTIIGNQITSDLPNGTFIILPFTWNTTNFVCSNYTLSAGMQPLPGGGNSTSSNCTGGNVIVTIPGDLNGDYTVNLSDLVILAKAYGTMPGDTNWNANADINGDGKVSLSDLTILAKNYHKSVTPSP
jgi:hypothetical protein